jgi:hypothetical protein
MCRTDMLYGLIAQRDTKFTLKIAGNNICNFDMKKGEFVHPLFNKCPLLIINLVFHNIELVSSKNTIPPSNYGRVSFISI